MSEFKSWRSYNLFAHETKRLNRYILSSDTKEFLNAVLATLKKREKTIPKGSIFWRAQLGHDLKPYYEDGEHIVDEECPYSSERMKPIPGRAKEGRANPKGIAYLYLATDKNTAMAEVRPGVDSFISVGQFSIKKNIKIVDSSILHEKAVKLYVNQPSPQKREEAVWSDIDRAFSSITTQSDDVADYVPTQILAELFKHNGYDGVVYKSNLGTGNNLVLFELNNADLKNCFLYKTKHIKFTFEQYPNPYFVVPKNGKTVEVDNKNH